MCKTPKPGAAAGRGRGRGRGGGGAAFDVTKAGPKGVFKKEDWICGSYAVVAAD